MILPLLHLLSTRPRPQYGSRPGGAGARLAQGGVSWSEPQAREAEVGADAAGSSSAEPDGVSDMIPVPPPLSRTGSAQ